LVELFLKLIKERDDEKKEIEGILFSFSEREGFSDSFISDANVQLDEAIQKARGITPYSLMTPSLSHCHNFLVSSSLYPFSLTEVNIFSPHEPLVP
jgi:hypothetical protein